MLFDIWLRRRIFWAFKTYLHTYTTNTRAKPFIGPASLHKNLWKYFDTKIIEIEYFIFMDAFKAFW